MRFGCSPPSSSSSSSMRVPRPVLLAAACWCYLSAPTGVEAFGSSRITGIGATPRTFPTATVRNVGRTSGDGSVLPIRPAATGHVRPFRADDGNARTATTRRRRPLGNAAASMAAASASASATRLYAAGLGAEGGDEGGSDPEQPQLYGQRWVQLAYLSLLALLSDWICFSVAASPSTFEAAYPGHSAANLIDIFLFTNVATCFLVTDIVNKFGLGKAIKGASVLMAVGCLLRSGVGWLIPAVSALGLNDAVAASLPDTGGLSIGLDYAASHSGLVPYEAVLAGTVLVGAAQPFFQCTPPFLSATWFGSEERATSTAVALNFNQIGIATAFLVGGGMATDAEGLANYFGVIAAACLLVTAGTLLQFQNRPPTPPSASEMEKAASGHEEPPFIESVKTFFKTPGFTRPLAAFICSISITNIVGAFIDELMERGGITEQSSIDFAGAGFELAILLGGIIIGGYVDKTKEYKSVTLKCILFTMFVLLPLGLTEHYIGNEPFLLVMALLGLGMACGPVQPINAELAVDVTYPGDETAVESVQQIGGNLVSALLVPVAEIALEQDYQLLPGYPALASDIRGDVVLLAALAGATYIYFSGFDSPLKRTEADGGHAPLDEEDGGVVLETVMATDVEWSSDDGNDLKDAVTVNGGAEEVRSAAAVASNGEKNASESGSLLEDMSRK